MGLHHGPPAERIIHQQLKTEIFWGSVMQVDANTIRKGHVMDYNGKLWQVIKSEILTPGKGAAVVQIEMRDVRAGNKTNVRFRTQETVERVQLQDHDMQYLFSADDIYTFMNQENFEQLTVPKDIIGDPVVYLQEGMICNVQTYENSALSVELPATVILDIVEADPVVKGQTASSSYKPAKLSNGVRVMVPPFVEAGTRIVVNTSDSSYVERARS
jgi:elongation factor P